MSPPRQTDRAFGLTFSALFAIVFGVGWLVFDARLDWAAVVAAVFLAAALTVPGILLPLNRMWGRIVVRLGVFNNYLLLGTFFYICILPMGAVFRLFGWDPMQRRPDPSADTYWTPVGRGAAKENFSDMF